MNQSFSKRVEEKYPKLTPSQTALSRFIIENHEEVPFLSAAKLARRVGTSNATVTRFCTALGYAGYAEFQKDRQRWLQMKLNPSQQLAQTIKKKKENVYAKIFQRDLQNLKETMEEISFAELGKAVQILSRSRQIYIIGLRSSFSLAYHLHHHLARILENLTLLDAAFGTLYDHLVKICAKDTLVVISFFRYARWTMETAKFAKERKAKIIALTDSFLSPIAKIADVVLQVKVASPAFFSSFTSAISVLNCLVEGVSLAIPKKAIQSLQEMELKLPQREIWLSNRG
jgi:DNA-binding MurR/RpiR family transcriptional regulator